MDDDDDVYGPVVPNAQRFTSADIAPLVLNLVQGILGAFYSTAVSAYNMAAQHANFKAEQARFLEEASLDIERIAAEPTDG